MLCRFQGLSGRRLVIEALKAQRVVGHDDALAHELAARLTLRQLSAGEVLIEQGDVDNDFFFVLAGQLAIWVHGRQVATRGAGTHVGEMALIDPSSRRSATVKAAELTVVAQISEAAFVEVADAHPRLWRSIAVELGRRLDERGRFFIQPNDTPVVFIGSSRESLAVAEALKRKLEASNLVVNLWSEGVFGVSRFPMEDLETQLKVADFAVLVGSADDRVTSRGLDSEAPRDNVVFELGLFMGALSRTRTFLLAPCGADLKIPTDLLGLTLIRFDPNASSVGRALTPACREIQRAIDSLGVK